MPSDPLASSSTSLLSECRALSPFVEVLFVGQVAASFAPPFLDRLAPWEQGMHVAATTLVGFSLLAVIAVSALHRRSPTGEGPSFWVTSLRVLLASLIPLVLAVGTEAYVVTRALLGSYVVAICAGTFGAALVGSGLVLPHARWLQRMLDDLYERTAVTIRK